MTLPLNTTETAERRPGWWTGMTVHALRDARRMSRTVFAAHLGVSARIVTQWEAGDRSMRPMPVNQAALDTSLAQCNAEETTLFWVLVSDNLCPTCGIGDKPTEIELPSVEPVLRRGRGRLRADVLAGSDFWSDPVIAQALATRDISAIYQYLQNRGVLGANIAYRTGQSQSEVSEVRAGRRSVRNYDLLLRIANGLLIPRGRLGLAYHPQLDETPLAEERAT